MTDKLNNFEGCTIENVTVHNRETEPRAPSHVTINVSGGSCTFNIYEHGPGPPQEEVGGKHPDDSQIGHSYRKRLSGLRRQICAYDGTQTPGADFWQALFETYEALERDLDGVIE